MESHFAPPERTDVAELRIEIETVTSNPIIDELLRSVQGLVAVLDGNRQVLALNRELLETAGVDAPEAALGLRPGELLSCVHAHEMEAGCGTSRFCSTCGAAIAITTSLATDKPVERACALHVSRDGEERDLYLSVRACPIRVSGVRFLLLFMQDISKVQQLVALEQVFFHDVNNLLSGLLTEAELLAEGGVDVKEMALEIAALTRRLHTEVVTQQALSAGAEGVTPQHLVTRPEKTTSGALLAEIERVFAHHPVARRRRLEIVDDAACALVVDVPLALRVVANMVTNACEASLVDAVIRVRARLDERGAVVFSVWNRGAIPQNVQRRVFQRNFSTKSALGRGLGTFSMKLLGETYLHGHVSFRSSEAEGTEFEIALPRSPAP